MDIFNNLMMAGRVPEANFEDVRAAPITCGYDPATSESVMAKRNWTGLSRVLHTRTYTLMVMAMVETVMLNNYALVILYSFLRASVQPL